MSQLHPDIIKACNDFLNTSLNAEQIKAATPAKGVLLVIAGAGSGKTRIIIARILNLIINHNVAPHAIVALTFTNKAAKEMRERIMSFLPPNSSLPFIGTFHAYCLTLLKRNATLLNLENFSVLDSEDQQKILTNLVKRANVGQRITTKNLGYYISALKNSPGKDLDFPSDPLLHELYRAYEREKELSKALDFDDLLLYVHKLFTGSVEFKMRHQSFVRHLLIDEYQDTNIIQHELLKGMALDGAHVAIDSVCAVGDEDQSIYSWRGATVANIMNFSKDFSGAVVVKVEQNYRSVQPILAVANGVIERNRYRNPKRLWSDKKAEDRVRLLSCLSGYQEADIIAQGVRTLSTTQKLSSMALLYRAHYQSRVLEEALIRRSIPYKIVGGVQFYERKEIKDIIAYLRVIANPFDRIAFSRIVNCPPRGLGQKFEEEFFQFWDQEPFLPCIQLIPRLIERKAFPPAKLQALAGLHGLVTSMSHQDKPSQSIINILAAVGYFAYLQNSFDRPEAEGKIDNIKELLRATSHFESNGIDTIEKFLQEVALMQDHMAQTQDGEKVQLMTIHAAKGLEFETVFLSGLEEGLFPSSHAVGDEQRLEEERRLFYVALTRAEQRLIISYARNRMTYGTVTDQAPSRFIADLPMTHIISDDTCRWGISDAHLYFQSWVTGQKSTSMNPVMTFGRKETARETATVIPAQKSTAGSSASNYPSAASTGKWKKHQAVVHQKFGVGIIQEIEKKADESCHLTISFKSGVKTIKDTFVQST